MPDPRDPADPKLADGLPAAFADGNASYNQTTKGFDLSSTEYYLVVEQGAKPYEAQLQYCKLSQAGAKNNPIAQMTLSTWDVVHDGQYDQQSNAFSYNNEDYVLALQDISGSLHAVAVKQ